MATRHLAVDEIDQHAHRGPRRRKTLTTTTVPTDAYPTRLIDGERTATALAHHFGRPQVTEVRRHGQESPASPEGTNSF